MKIDNIQPNNDFMAQFLAKQDMPKPDKTAFSELAAQPQKDTFEPSSKTEAKETEPVKSDDTFVKSEVKPAEEEIKEQPKEEPAAEVKEEVKDVPEQPQEEVKVDEVKEEEIKEEVPEEQQNQQGEENVKKKTNFIDKIKNFFKNLFIKKKPNETNAEETAKYSSAGSTN